MKGFEIRLNNEDVIKASIDTGFLPVIFTINNGEAYFTISGLTADSFNYIDYGFTNLKVEDCITVKLTDSPHNSPPLRIRPRSRNEMVEEYKELKIQLEKEGLL